MEGPGVAAIVSTILASAGLAEADEVYPGVRYMCGGGYFHVFPTYVENPSVPLVPEPGFFPHVDASELSLPLPVAECEIGGARLALSLVFQNTPRPAGICGASLWGKYLIERDGEEVLTFGIGCFEDSYVVANDTGLSVCYARGHECQALLWDEPTTPVTKD